MLGKTIQQKRKEVGLTQAQLANRLGVTAPAVNRWEKDMSFPDANLLAPLARCLKTDLNELFSFYDSLSDKERELIVDRARVLLLTASDEEAMAFIEGAVQENLSDGLLYKELAGMIFGVHTLVKASGSTIYLERIAEYYERALELLPEDEEEISHTLISIYAQMQDAEKTKAAWERLKETMYDKKWAHAEMLYALKEYTCAIPELEECILRKVIDLSTSLDLLRDALSLDRNTALAVIAEEKAAELRQLFGLWDGVDMLSQINGAVATSDGETEEILLSDFFNMMPKDEKISSCPLFENVVLGGTAKDKSTTADLMADLLNALKGKTK